jgi:hypothetical protein
VNIISIDRKKENNMILKKITIENFRCFKNYEVDLTPGITVFIGKNGAGKTSLLNAIRYGLSVFFSNDSTMGDDLLISGNPDLKVISTLATDFYRAQNADLPAVDLTINMEAEFNDIPLNWEYYKRSTSGASLFVSKYQQAYRTLMAEYHNSDQPLEQVLSKVSPNRICMNIRNGRISPWLLYQSHMGQTFLDQLNDNLVDMVIDVIQPVQWQVIFKRYPERVAEIKQTFEELGL